MERFDKKVALITGTKGGLLIAFLAALRITLS